MRILVVTSGRADHTPIKPLMKYCDGWLDVEGCTFDKAAKTFSKFVRYDRPDLLLVLGDRFEILAVCGAATYERIPIAHIHGGEASFGSFDNQIRDAITKLSHIHFVAAEPYRERVISLGEHPDMVFTVGAPGLDNLPDLPRRPGKYFVATYHPETLGETDTLPLLEALQTFPDYEVYWTGVNNDPGAEIIKADLENATVYRNLGMDRYLALVRNAAAVVGNSSSGIIEAPSLEVPTVNVGSRQDGRLKGPSVFDCTNDRHDIENSIRAALEYDGPFANPYGEKGASRKIANILRNVEIRMRKEWLISLPNAG